MDETKAKSELSFGRAYRMLEALVQADFRDTARKAVVMAFGASSEFKLVKVLAGAKVPLRLSEVSVRSGTTHRAMSRQGSLRHSLERMERAGMVINVGSTRRPLYQLNLLNDESKLLVVLFEGDSPTVDLPALPPRE